jgi:hypothetical protein
MAKKEIQVYPAGDGPRWRKISGGDIVADSGEAYASTSGAKEAADREAAGTDYEVVVYDHDPLAPQEDAGAYDPPA